MAFLYFVPASQKQQAGLDELAYAFEATPHRRDVFGSGPGGSKGTLYASCSSFGYYPDRQQWTRMPNSQCWIGWEAEQPPTPDDLRRDTMLDGNRIELHDGNEWLIPATRALVSDDGEVRWKSLLPQRVAVDQDGTWVYAGVLPRLQRLYDIGTRWAEVRFSALTEAGEAVLDIDPQDALTMAVEVLGFNYRVTLAEVSALGLFAETSFIGVLDAAINFKFAMELLEAITEKKTEQHAATLNIAAGA